MFGANAFAWPYFAQAYATGEAAADVCFTYEGDDSPTFTYQGATNFTYQGDDSPTFTYEGEC